MTLVPARRGHRGRALLFASGASRQITDQDNAVSAFLVARELEAMSVNLLRRAWEATDAMTLPRTTHAAYKVLEFHHVVREHRMTPIDLAR